MFSINHEYFCALASEKKVAHVDLVSGSTENETVERKSRMKGGCPYLLDILNRF